MGNPYFRFKQFTIYQDRCAMKVCTDACLFGAWSAALISNTTLKIKNVLDIGTGTGLLSLMLAQKNKDIHIDAVEIDENACQQAVENINASPWKANIHIHHASIKAFNFQKQYDCIISNPPFYEQELKSANDEKNKAHHSTGLTLEELLYIIEKQLKPSGIFLLLLPYKRTKEAAILLQKHSLRPYQQIFIKQSAEHNFFRTMICGGLSKEAVTIKEITITNAQQQYTPEFTALLKDYYLYL